MILSRKSLTLIMAIDLYGEIQSVKPSLICIKISFWHYIRWYNNTGEVKRYSLVHLTL